MLKVKHGKEIVLKVTNESGVPAATGHSRDGLTEGGTGVSPVAVGVAGAASPPRFAR